MMSSLRMFRNNVPVVHTRVRLQHQQETVLAQYCYATPEGAIRIGVTSSGRDPSDALITM